MTLCSMINNVEGAITLLASPLFEEEKSSDYMYIVESKIERIVDCTDSLLERQEKLARYSIPCTCTCTCTKIGVVPYKVVVDFVP